MDRDTVTRVPAGDERRHRSGPEQLWGESWDFEFAELDGSLGGYVRLGLYPNLGVAWYWAALAGRGRRLVTVRDHDVALPRGGELEVRGEGLWSAINCETPLDHWSVGLEAFGVGMDDPTEAYRSGWGDRVGLGFDLEWEAVADAEMTGPGRYQQACQVYGEILVGEEVLACEGVGLRRHQWGPDDWWTTGWRRAWGALDDGTRLGADGDPRASGTPVAQAPLLVEGPAGQESKLARTLCRYNTPDGRIGAGWTDDLQT